MQNDRACAGSGCLAFAIYPIFAKGGVFGICGLSYFLQRGGLCGLRFIRSRHSTFTPVGFFFQSFPRPGVFCGNGCNLVVILLQVVVGYLVSSVSVAAMSPLELFFRRFLVSLTYNSMYLEVLFFFANPLKNRTRRSFFFFSRDFGP